MSVGEIMGIGALAMNAMGRRIRGNEQLDQQEELTKIQEAANKRLAKFGMGLQKQMYDYQFNKNTPEAMRKLYEEAGMNPALAYTQGGVGGVSGGSVSGGAGMGQASDQASLEAQTTAKMGMAIQAAMAKSQMKVNESLVTKNEADARNKDAGTETEEKSRDLMLENLKQAGMAQWIENEKQKYNLGNAPDDGNQSIWNWQYGDLEIKDTSNFNQEVTSAIARTQAETGAAEAMAALNDEKKRGYYQELLNATKNADSERIKAVAVKLAAEWQTGEFSNWKTWTELGKDGVGLITDVIKAAAMKGKQ